MFILILYDVYHKIMACRVGVIRKTHFYGCQGNKQTFNKKKNVKTYLPTRMIKPS